MILNQPSGETICGDKVGGDKIMVGDLAGSYNAIGAGAQVIVTQIQQAVSTTAVLEEANLRAEQALSSEGRQLKCHLGFVERDFGRKEKTEHANGHGLLLGSGFECPSRSYVCRWRVPLRATA